MGPKCNLAGGEPLSLHFNIIRVKENFLNAKVKGMRGLEVKTLYNLSLYTLKINRVKVSDKRASKLYTHVNSDTGSVKF